ncbi:MAG TPA: DUF4956 domain-containing protein [Gemmatimonadales bacterium]|nr:DUF4956 domain-containing protein [Gemmatimonadales bacterium]
MPRPRSRRRRLSPILCLLALLLLAPPAAGQAPAPAPAPAPAQEHGQPGGLALPESPLRREAPEPWKETLVALPLAALLGAALAFRPVRRGTPPRDLAVIQTQIVLAVVGAVIMLVVGASLARAFGIVGAASLVRYRAKIGDPKDAAVMLSALGIGLATGVGIYATAALTTAFLLVVLWALESIEPTPKRVYTLTVKDDDAHELRPAIERLLKRQSVAYELRTTSGDELCYQIELPVRRRTAALVDAIQQLDKADDATVEVEPAKKK